VTDSSRRMRRERRTVEVMLSMHCRGNHANKKGLCEDCLELLEYSRMRLDKCPFVEDKPTCAKCPTHCYEREHREQMKAVMRYSGPRMVLRHPVLAILHMLDGRT
jgi:predicted amidophosphoribosyltransferase